MSVGLADFILEAFACEVAVEGLISLYCVLLEYLFCFHFVCPSMFVIVFILVFFIEKPPASVTSQGAMFMRFLQRTPVERTAEVPIQVHHSLSIQRL